MKAVPRDLGAVLGGFLVFCGAQLSKRNLCGARFVFRGPAPSCAVHDFT